MKIDHYGILTNHFSILHQYREDGAKLIEAGSSCGCFCYFFKHPQCSKVIEIVIPYNNKKLKRLAKKLGTHLHHTAYVTKKKPKKFKRGAIDNTLIYFKYPSLEYVYYEKN